MNWLGGILIHISSGSYSHIGPLPTLPMANRRYHSTITSFIAGHCISTFVAYHKNQKYIPVAPRARRPDLRRVPEIWWKNHSGTCQVTSFDFLKSTCFMVQISQKQRASTTRSQALKLPSTRPRCGHTKGWAILENLWRPSLDGRTYDQLDDQHADMNKWWILSGGTSHCDFLQKLEIATPIFASLIFGSFTNGNDDKPLCWWVNFHPTVGKGHGDSTGFCWCFTTVSYRFP